MEIVKEYDHIVEYCYIPKQKKFVIRFLDGSSYVLSVTDLPKKLQTRNPDWENTKLSVDSSSLIVEANNDFRQIPAHIIHARGKES